MIVDRIEGLDKYNGSIPNLSDALKFINENINAKPGKYVFENGFAIVQAGTTIPADSGMFEIHREYLDLQVLLEGNEYILWNRVEKMTLADEYDPEKDKLALKGEGSILEMQPGMCCILFPSDAHKGGRHIGLPLKYKKIIIKLKLR
ncbi:MAG: YhcH/YjgK/YiaL family protein [Oscillospiraceae bacterium]